MVQEPMLQAVICDMDGVLFDSEPLHIRAWRAWMGKHGLQFPPEWFLQWVGVPDRALAEYLNAACCVPVATPLILEEKRALYRAITSQELRPFPGVPDALGGLCARGLPLALATSSPHGDVAHTLGVTGLAEFFPVRVASEDVTHHKPAPDCYLRAAGLLGVPAANCGVVEDSPAGVAAACAAGCVVAAVTSSQPAEKLAAARRVFATSAEALDWLREQAGKRASR